MGGVLGEVGLVVWQLGHSGPHLLVRGAHDFEDSDQLVADGRAGEEGTARGHLGKDAASGPDVDGRGVLARAHEHVGGTVPQGDDLVRVRADGNAESTGKTEVSKLELALLVDEEVLGLEVTVEDTVVVAEGDAAEELEEEGLHGLPRDLAAALVEVLLEVLVQVLEDQRQLLLRVDHVI